MSRHPIPEGRHTAVKHPAAKALALRRAAVVTLACFAVASCAGVLAQTYYLDNGSITVEGFSDGTYVTQADQTFRDDDEIIIRQNAEDDLSEATENTITIISQNTETPEEEKYLQADQEAGLSNTAEPTPSDADSKTTVEVTLGDLCIEATDKIDANVGNRVDNYQAAISVQGDGDVTLELDGTATVSSGRYHAGIEKNDSQSSGTLTITNTDGNGTLNATGGVGGAGIGSGYLENTSSLVLAGGDITATGGSFGAGIGGGYGTDPNSVYVKNYAGNADVTITGGTIHASSTNRASGIGGGYAGNGTITITGGAVTASAGNVGSTDENDTGGGAGIGGGLCGSGTVTITGGTIDASSATYGAGIGGGYIGNGTITVNGGTINASSGDGGVGLGGGAGIGGGWGGSGTVTITDGIINRATGIDGGAGIGSGYKSDADVTVSGGTITAVGGDSSAGIGSGCWGSATVTIENGTIRATGGECAAGVGSGFGGTADVTICGGVTTAAAGASPYAGEVEPEDIGRGGYSASNQEPTWSLTWTDGIIIKETAGGKTCSHVWDRSTLTLIDADNCTDRGEKHTYCALCGSIKKELNPYEHLWDSGTVVKQPTATEEGEMLYRCTTIGCSATRTEPIPKLDPDSGTSSAPNTSPMLIVTTLTGLAQPYEQSLEAGRSLYAAPAQSAILTGPLGCLEDLRAKGIRTLVFRTQLCETSFSIDQLLAAGSEDDTLTVIHTDAEARITINGQEIVLPGQGR